MKEYMNGSVPVSVAARVYGKDACWIRAGLIGTDVSTITFLRNCFMNRPDTDGMANDEKRIRN